MESEENVPPGERHYVALAKMETKVDAILGMVKDMKEQNRREHDSIVSGQDSIRADMAMCPHVKIEQTEKDIKSLQGSVKSIVLFGSTILGGIVVGSVLTMLRVLFK